MPESGGYYAVIPADVRYDAGLTPNAKLLYGELTALSDKKGYCWATNEHFARLYGLSISTISRIMSQLEKRGYIRCEMAATEKGSERRIYAGAFLVSTDGGLRKNDDTPPGKNAQGGLRKNAKQNNTGLSAQEEAPPKAPPGGRRGDEPRAGPEWKPERFAGFWSFYPRGEAKQRAIRAWDKLKPSDEMIDTMAQALKRQVASEAWQQGIGIPYASTWINQRRWEDEVRPRAPAGGSAPKRVLEEKGAYYL